MSDPLESQAAAELLKAFAHPTRVSILQELLVEPKCVTDMEELLPARQSNISQHLAVLRYTKLVDYAQDGALKCYYLCRPNLVRELLALVARGDPVLKRTAQEIKVDKDRLANARATTERPSKSKRHRAKVTP